MMGATSKQSTSVEEFLIVLCKPVRFIFHQVVKQDGRPEIHVKICNIFLNKHFYIFQNSA